MRIITRPDFDGLVCAVFIKAAKGRDIPVVWIEPDEMRNGGFEPVEGDIIANLPWKKGCSMWFDHHVTNRISEPFEGAFDIVPSAAGLVHEYYKKIFIRDFSALSAAADKIDSADLAVEEVLKPEEHPYLLVSMTIKNRAECDAAYWNLLCDLFIDNEIDVIMKNDNVRARCDEVIAENAAYRGYIESHTRFDGGVAVTDFTCFETAPQGNRFLVYALYPDACVAVKIRRDYHDPDSVIVSVGHSIFKRTCRVNSGYLLSRFGGGGHFGAGACKMKVSILENALDTIIKTLKANREIEI